MIPDRSHLIYFSPTHTSKQVATAIVYGIGMENVVETDVTNDGTVELNIEKEELAVFAVPVYGGKVAPLALVRMNNIKGDETPAVVVVVYGNRAYEGALAELNDFVSGNGFRVIAAGAFIGEHSFNTKEYPIADSRPDYEDIAFATEFGKHVMEKLGEIAADDEITPVNVRTLRRPSQQLLPILLQVRQFNRIRTGKVETPKVPVFDVSLCTRCGTCINKCPDNAIEEIETDLIIDQDKCIRCCSCVKSCPQEAWSYNTPWGALLSKCFAKRKKPQVLY